MCTQIAENSVPRDTCYAYKVVLEVVRPRDSELFGKLREGQVRSLLLTDFRWRRARWHTAEIVYGKTVPVLPGRLVEGGVFHCFKLKRDAMRLYNERCKVFNDDCYSEFSPRLIRLKLESPVEGTAKYFGAGCDGMPMYVARRAYWDGKFIL